MSSYLDLPVYHYGDELCEFPEHWAVHEMIADNQPAGWAFLLDRLDMHWATIRAAVDDLMAAGMVQATNDGLRCTTVAP